MERLNESDGDRFVLLPRGLLESAGVGRRFSFRRNGLEGRTGTDPGRALAIFFRLDRGMRVVGRVDGIGSFSLAA